jgi:putative peptidoglycan lipid II flippase
MPRLSTSRYPLWWGALTVVALGLVAKLCGAFKEVVTAKTLGTSEVVDQFVFAFTVATWPAGLAASVLVATLTPLLAKMQQNQDAAMPGFMAQLWGVSLAISLALSVVLAVVFPWLSPVAQAGGLRLALMVGAVCFLSCLTALLGVILVARNIQIGTLLEGLPSLLLGILLALGIWQASAVLVYGVVAGLALQLGMLWHVHHHKVGAIRVNWPSKSRQASAPWRALAAGLGYTTAGYAIHATVTLADLAIASRMDTGSVASLSYAGRVTALAMGLAATVVYRVTIVHFCQAPHVHGKGHQVWGSVLGLFSAGSLVVSALLIAFSDELVTLIFQRGQFDAQASETVAHLMRWGVACLAPYVATAVLSAYLSAVGGFKQIFVSCLVCFAVHMAVLWLGTGRYGLTAIVAAPLIGHVVMLVYLLITVAKRSRPMPARAQPV